MSQQKNGHLDDEQIIQAVVDETDLPAPLRTHLADCSQCRVKKERLSQSLLHLGRMAQNLAPSPRQGIMLPAEKASRAFWLQAWQWRSLLTAGVAVALVVAVVWWKGPVTTTPESQQALLGDEMREDEELMTEIRWLEEHALPLTYSDISGEYSSSSDDEFMEFLIPDTHNDTLSRDTAEEVRYAV